MSSEGVAATDCESCVYLDHEYDELIASPQLARHSVDVVVSRWKENVNWTKNLRGCRVVVYDKGDPLSDNHLQNVGREAHTYLHHIVTHYDRLPDYTLFLQGDPFDHVPDLYDQFARLNPTLDFKSLSDFVLIEKADGEPTHSGLPLGGFYGELFGEPSPSVFVSHAAACFLVSGERIRRRSRSFYERALRCVVDHPHGPWCIERMWADVFAGPTESEGIVTACDANLFDDLQWLLRSLRASPQTPVAVFDLGMTGEQRRWCLRLDNVTVCDLPTPNPVFRRAYSLPAWQCWVKPLCVWQAPFDRVLWIDADCLALHDLAGAFEIVRQRPLLTRDPLLGVAINNPELYRRLPLPLDRLRDGLDLNAGVVGLCKVRDRSLLSHWLYAVQWAMQHPDSTHLVGWCDQGALLWALYHEDLTHLIRQDFIWNSPGAMPCIAMADPADPRDLLSRLRCQCPDVRIMHYLGPRKLSRQLNELPPASAAHALPREER